MGKHFRRHTVNICASVEAASLAVLGICFCISGAAGCFFRSNESASAISQVVQNTSAAPVLFPSVFAVFLEFFLPALLCCASGFSALGVVLIPAVLSVRAFLLSYVLSALFRAFGFSGLVVSAGLFALHVIAAIPALFAIGCTAFASALSKLPVIPPSPNVAFRSVTAVLSCAVPLFAATLLQWALMPHVYSSVVSALIHS